ncbi:MAG: ABC transporter substrate-binding protein [Spirochaetaceae bacterium]|jgi:ABC-type nitrate/sulfonate/bicarbonate transport system substrate-binding protein|nr:ABC transporter substrate-binding protein [Spirochaetaceae bacterium]
MTKRRFFGNGAALLLAALLAGGALTGCARKTKKLTQVERDGKTYYQIKTWSRSDCTDAPFVVAENMGFFAEEGIEIVYTGETQPPQRIASILNGDNDVGTAHPNTLAIARDGGAPVRGVARSIIEPPPEITDIHLQHMWWVARKDGPIQTLTDIKTFPGKVKLQLLLRNACIDFLTDMILAQYGIPKDKIEYITMPDIEGVLALKEGLVDIITPHPPFYNAVEEWGGGNILITSREIAGENAGTYLYYFADDFIEVNREPIKHFVAAIKKAERWANKNPEQTAKWTEAVIGIPVQANHYYSENAVIYDDQIQYWIDGSITSGALPPDTKVTVADIITHEFEGYGNP